MEAMTTDTGAVVIYTRISDERYESLLVLLGPKGSGSGFWAIRNWTGCHLSGTGSAAGVHQIHLPGSAGSGGRDHRRWLWPCVTGGDETAGG